MRLRRAYSILASLLLITTLMIAAGCQDEDLPGMVGGSGRNTKNATPTPSPPPSKEPGAIETAPPESPPPSTDPGATPQSLVITPGAQTIGLSTDGFQFALAIAMSDGTTITDPTQATWTSSNTGWATISATGLAKGVSPGTVVIMAKAKKNSAILSVATLTVVSAPVAPTAQSVAVSPKNTSFVAANGGTVQLSALVTMSDATTNSNVTWSSSNSSRAAVNGSGLVTVPAGSTSETVTITATALNSSVSDTATIAITSTPATPTPPPATVTGVTVTTNKESISVGPEGNPSAAQLMPKLKLSDGSEVFSSDVTWNSSHPNVATVSAFSQVVVPAGVTPGTYSVTFTATAKNTSISGTVTMTITILKTVTGVTIAPPSTSAILAGGSLQLSATKTMSDGSTETSGITWKSSNDNLATVSSSGLVSVPTNLIGDGTVTITASASGRSASVVLTVKQPPSVASIAVTPKTVTINAAPASGTPASGFVTSAQLTVTATLTDGSTMSYTNVNWTSADERSLRVSSTGVVTAPSTATPGTYRVTAQVKGSSFSSWADVTVKTDGRVNIIVQ